VPFLAYGLASTVSISRIGAQKHFPSDVLAGSAIGFLLGRFVYRQHKADEYAREQKWKKLIPDIGPSFAHGGIGVSMNWNLSKN
jgi:membrane-associated phospholipid phosphatase